MWIVVPEPQLGAAGVEALRPVAAPKSPRRSGAVHRGWWCRGCAVGWVAERRQRCWMCESDGRVEPGTPRLCA